MGSETTDRHRGACVRKEVAARWKVSFMVQVGREIFEQHAGRKRSSCGNPRLILYINVSMSMPGRRVAGPFWAQAVNQKKTTFTNRYLQIAVPQAMLKL